MPTQQIISSEEARRRFAELVSSAFYSGKQTAVTKNNRPMAWIVGEPFMQGLHDFLSLLEKINPSLADTLVLYLNENARKEIEQAEAEIEEGRVVPFESILDAE